MYEIIVFDLDGTLLDTLQDLADAVNFSLAKNDRKKRTLAEVKSFVGNGVRNLMQKALGEEHIDILDKAVTDFFEYYSVHSADKTKPYEGMIPLLAELQKRNIKTALLSNKPDKATKQLAERFFEGLFTEVMGENESLGIRKKPAPDALFALLERQGIKKENALYVGDSEVDIQTAKNAGVSCVSVTWGFKDREFLLQNGATLLVDKAMDMLKVIEVKQ